METTILFISLLATSVNAAEINYTYQGNHECDSTVKKLERSKTLITEYLLNSKKCSKAKVKTQITKVNRFSDDYEINVIASCGDNVDEIEITELECHTYSWSKLNLHFSIFNHQNQERKVKLFLGKGSDF